MNLTNPNLSMQGENSSLTTKEPNHHGKSTKSSTNTVFLGGLEGFGIQNDYHRKSLSELEQECLVFMAEHSFPIDKIAANNSWQRLSIDGGKDQDEWYIAHSGISAKGNPWLMCTFGTWKGGKQEFGTYKSWDQDKFLTSQERQIIIREHSKWEKQNTQHQFEEKQRKIEKAKAVWESSSSEPYEHIGHLGYLSRKKVGIHGVRFGERIFEDGIQYPTLIVPLRDGRGELQAIQHIRKDGEKRFSGPKNGGFHVMGTISPDSQIYVAEGYATAASIFAAKGCPTVVAFDCGNLEPVIAALRQLYPRNSITIGGDDDVDTPGNPGRTKAQEAAKKYQCKVLFPTFPSQTGQSKRLTDWNDLHVHFGIEEVAKQIDAFQKPKPRLVSLSYQELLQKEIPERKFVLRPWLSEAALTMVFAPPGVGKSYLCLSAAGTIASGGTLFKTSPWIAERPARVLYIDGEMHESDLQTRVRKLLHHSGENIAKDYLRYLNGSWQSEFLPDLASPDGQRLIEELIAEQGTEVLFLDNLSTLCRFGKENETDSWKQMQSWLLQLRWRGIAVVLVHHAGKSKDESGKPRQRGTSMREVVLESSIVLDRPKDYSEEMGCVFELSYTKARGFFGADAVPIEVRLIEREGGFFWEDKKLSIKTYDTIVEAYNEGTTTVRELAAELQISPQAIRKHIRNAKAKGDIQ